MKASSADFFNKDSLKNFSFYYHLPDIDWKQKTELSLKIQNNQGKNSFSLSSKSIIIIEKASVLSSQKFLSLINSFGNIIAYMNNHIEIIEHNPNNPETIKVILFNDIVERIEMFDVKNDYFFHLKNGLPASYDKNYIISALFYYKGNKIIKHHYFSPITINNEVIADIPYFNPKIPLNFSLFSSDYEKIKIDDYERKKKSNKKKKSDYSKEKIDLKIDPEPYPQHFFCQLCGSRFDNYQAHLKSKIHVNNIEKNFDVYNRIKTSLVRIRHNFLIRNEPHKPEEKPFQITQSQHIITSLDDLKDINPFIEPQTTIGMSTNTNTFNESKKNDEYILMKGMLMHPISADITRKDIIKLDKKRKYCQFEDFRDNCGLPNPPVRSMFHADNKTLIKYIDKCLKKVTKLSNKHKENSINKNDKV